MKLLHAAGHMFLPNLQAARCLPHAQIVDPFHWVELGVWDQVGPTVHGWVGLSRWGACGVRNRGWGGGWDFDSPQICIRPSVPLRIPHSSYRPRLTLSSHSPLVHMSNVRQKKMIKVLCVFPIRYGQRGRIGLPPPSPFRMGVGTCGICVFAYLCNRNSNVFFMHLEANLKTCARGNHPARSVGSCGRMMVVPFRKKTKHTSKYLSGGTPLTTTPHVLLCLQKRCYLHRGSALESLAENSGCEGCLKSCWAFIPQIILVLNMEFWA